MSTATAKAYNYSAISDAFSYWPEYGKPRKQAVSGLIVHMGVVSKITS